MSDSKMTDSQFYRSLTAMIAGFVAFTFSIVALAGYVSSDVDARLDAERQSEVQQNLASQLVPVGKINVGEMQAAAPVEVAQAMSGEEVYNKSCVACHGAGIAGAPKVGDAAAWADRIAQGVEVIYGHAINGFSGNAGYMPAKGGNPSLADADIHAAVDFMIGQSK